LTYNHLILKAVGMALRAVPRVNATFVNSSLVQPQDCNVGIVTAIPDGLLIPVLKRADQLSLSDIVTESKALVQRARAGRPKADDLSGGTFSVSNMGIFPVESFSAIISPGQGGILAVSSINEEPIVSGGEIKAAQVMRVTLSVDHRIIDGIVAGEFLKEFKRIVEDPILLLA
jgi:pyruvate dehydrogenase E2 component (dihydrolipoamide acetyltransferase)